MICSCLNTKKKNQLQVLLILSLIQRKKRLSSIHAFILQWTEATDPFKFKIIDNIAQRNKIHTMSVKRLACLSILMLFTQDIIIKTKHKQESEIKKCRQSDQIRSTNWTWPPVSIHNQLCRETIWQLLNMRVLYYFLISHVQIR